MLTLILALGLTLTTPDRSPLSPEATIKMMHTPAFKAKVRRQMAKTKPAETKRRIKILDKSLKSK